MKFGFKEYSTPLLVRDGYFPIYADGEHFCSDNSVKSIEQIISFTEENGVKFYTGDFRVHLKSGVSKLFKFCNFKEIEDWVNNNKV